MNKKYVVPALIERPDEVILSEGLLFRLPIELAGSAKMRVYQAQSRIGWHKIDFGYFMYIHSSDELGLVRFLGLSPRDTKPTRSLGVVHPFSRQEFEAYVESLVEGERQLRSRIKEEIALLIHDLRRFSNSIYQNAVATKKAIWDGDSEEAGVRIGNTIAAQAMLSIRTDILDLTESRDFQMVEENVPVYRKIDKVVRSFQPGCALKGTDISISGTSHSFVRGPDCVEIVGYILCDNALKYTPLNHKISVTVTEVSSEICVNVTSLGPLIEPEELDLIFEKGFRSKAAKSVEANGTGYGLYLARSLVGRFNGRISVEQYGDIIKTNRGAYRDTTFRVFFPIAERRDQPLHGSLERKGPPRPFINSEQKEKIVGPKIAKDVSVNATPLDVKNKQRTRQRRRNGKGRNRSKQDAGAGPVSPAPKS